MKMLSAIVFVFSLSSAIAATLVAENATYEGELYLQNKRQGQSCTVQIGKITANPIGKNCFNYEVSSSILSSNVTLHPNITRMDSEGSHCAAANSFSTLVQGEISSKERVHLALQDGELYLNDARLKFLGTTVSRCQNLKRIK